MSATNDLQKTFSTSPSNSSSSAQTPFVNAGRNAFKLDSPVELYIANPNTTPTRKNWSSLSKLAELNQHRL
ncbi:unnamed protein product [Mucor circinelloides]|uniref:Uncharacterized protein n=1 Tax=Mucor circinelloides f. circinelloides (strain 1006PhL) TaxID=1220926 RepID=S2JQK5_MUCC1|nr:hypothetical protein HMPREF1544_11215 [Mucor circinelloides 1006PhL]